MDGFERFASGRRRRRRRQSDVRKGRGQRRHAVGVLDGPAEPPEHHELLRPVEELRLREEELHRFTSYRGRPPTKRLPFQRS